MEKQQNFLTKEEYIYIKNKAIEDMENISYIDLKEKFNQGRQKAEVLFGNTNNEKAALYISNFMIPNDLKFIEKNNNFNNNIKEIAEEYRFDKSYGISLVAAKIFEINKYYKKYIMNVKETISRQK